MRKRKLNFSLYIFVGGELRISFLIGRFGLDEDFITEENFCMIRNDLKEIHKSEITESSNVNVDGFSEDQFQKELNEIKRLLSNEADVVSKLETINNYSDVGFLFGNEEASIVSRIITRVLIDVGREGRSIQKISFDKMHFDSKDNPSQEELYYRRIWNRAILNQKTMNRLILWSLILEVNSEFHRLIIDGLDHFIETGSRIDTSKHIIEQVKN